MSKKGLVYTLLKYKIVNLFCHYHKVLKSGQLNIKSVVSKQIQFNSFDSLGLSSIYFYMGNNIFKSAREADMYRDATHL